MSVCVCQFFASYTQPRFQRISTKFGVWYPYTRRMVTRVGGKGGGTESRRRGRWGVSGATLTDSPAAKRQEE